MNNAFQSDALNPASDGAPGPMADTIPLARPCHRPAIPYPGLRAALGFVMICLASWISQTRWQGISLPHLIGCLVLPWMVSWYFTDKYRHKYPQRYVTYLLAQHLKALLIMGLGTVLIGWIAQRQSVLPLRPLLTSFILFAVFDFVAALPCRAFSPELRPLQPTPSQPAGGSQEVELLHLDGQALVRACREASMPSEVLEFLEPHLAREDGQGSLPVACIKDLGTQGAEGLPGPLGVLAGRVSLNRVDRLHQFLLFCASRVAMGGFLVVSYTALEHEKAELDRRFPKGLRKLAHLAHFLRYRALPKIPVLDRLYFSPAFRWIDGITTSLGLGRYRVLSKAETWGRLSYCGFQVVAESQGEGEVLVLAKRTAPVSKAPRTSYYMVTSLEKVGLLGQPTYTHKVRTMYPFSEFLQKRIFEDNGLNTTGKFANDFRLTDYGVFLRKYWLDELPQVFDWLRGELKLVGMRATSRHFMSLYPQYLYNLYIQIKPGLVPPIFDENTSGFEQIVQVEWSYLRRYWEHPIRTDVSYFFQTFNDIFFRGIRSK